MERRVDADLQLRAEDLQVCAVLLQDDGLSPHAVQLLLQLRAGGLRLRELQ